MFVCALCAVAIAILEKQPSYGNEQAVAASPPAAVLTQHTVRAGARTATIEPAKGLINQVAKVSWTGFHPTDALGNFGVIIYQCTASPVSLDDCFTVSPFPNSAGGNAILTGVTQPAGTGDAFFEIRNSSKLPDLNCSDTVPCSLVLYENDGNPPPVGSLPTSAVVVPITFARSSADCPVPDHLDVRAEGEASGANLFYNWVGQLCEGTPKLALDYTETSSNNGRASELAGQADLGVTSLGATKEELAASAAHTTYEYAPLDLNAVVVAFNIQDSVTNQQILDVTLTPRLIARLVTDSQLLDFFNDPEFQALNPGHTWPSSGASQPLLRAERNADTRLITSWMIQDQDAKDLIAAKDKYGVRVTPDFYNKTYPVDNFEKAASDDGFSPRTGEEDVALHTFYGVKPADATTTRPSVQGFFAIVDRSTATQYGLPMAKLVNHAGTAVAPDDAGVIAGYGAMTTLDGVKVADFTSTEASQYPLTKIDYAMVRRDVTRVDSTGKVVGDPTKAKSFKDFLDYAAVAGQQHLLGGYMPLPAEEVTLAQHVAGDLRAPVEPHPTTTTTVPATTTTTPSPPVTFGSCCSGSSSGSSGTDYTSPTPTTAPGDGTTPTTKVPRTTPTTTRRYKLVAAQAPNWSPVGTTGTGGSSIALSLILLLGLAALAGRIAWYTSPKMLARIRARSASTAGDAR